MLRTPKNRAAVVAVAAVLYLTAPIVEWFYFSTELTRGGYPANADSIAIPIGTFTLVWLIGLPLVGLLVWLALRSYPGSVSLFGFNVTRPYWSAVWSVLFAYLVFQDIFFCVQSVFRGNPLDVAQSGLMAYLFLCLRSSIVYGGLSLPEGKVAAGGEA